jgi:hypothetical protein
MSERRIKCFFVEYVNDGKDGNDLLWRRTDTGEEFSHLADVPVGGMWFAHWYENFWHPQLGPGKNLIVKTPGGDWHIDSNCNNCTIPDDASQEKHHCWILHGTPPEITVDKNGVTCGAGAGSILTANGKYHGFLRNGYLEGC